MNPGVSTDATARMARVQWAHGAHRLNSVKPETNSKATKHRFCCFSSGCWIAVYHIFLQNSPMPACRVPSKKHTIFTPCQCFRMIGGKTSVFIARPQSSTKISAHLQLLGLRTWQRFSSLDFTLPTQGMRPLGPHRFSWLKSLNFENKGALRSLTRLKVKSPGALGFVGKS